MLRVMCLKRIIDVAHIMINLRKAKTRLCGYFQNIAKIQYIHCEIKTGYLRKMGIFCIGIIIVPYSLNQTKKINMGRSAQLESTTKQA